jgi:hypothetical protein
MAHMKQMDSMIAKMTDAAKKKDSTSLDMSKATMKKGDTAGCMKGAGCHGPLIQGE